MDYLLITLAKQEYQEKLDRAAHQRRVYEFEQAQAIHAMAVTPFQSVKVALGSYLVRLGESLQGHPAARHSSVNQPFELATAKS